MRQSVLGLVVLGALAVLSARGRAQSIAVQVSDLHDQPVAGVVLSISGRGSTGPATDVAGKTELIPPIGTQPGDWIVLTLVKATSLKDPIFYSPWEGNAIAPKTQGFIRVVIGTRGDAAALKNSAVLISYAATVIKLNHLEAQDRAPSTESRIATRAKYAETLGLKPEQLDDALRSSFEQAGDSRFDALRSAYLADYPVGAPKHTQDTKPATKTE